MTRTLTYAEAIREAHAQLLRSDPRVFVIGQGLWSPWYVGTSMKDLDAEFGRERIIDTPVSENGITGAGIGAALAGMRPIIVHPRMDFLLLAMDQLVNEAANWSYMFGGRSSVPIVVRPIINRGGEQAAQHSQAFHAWLMHVPGLKVVLPAIPRDAKGLLIAAVRDENPVVYIDDRWLYNERGEVPEEMYETPIGRAAIRREGTDVTVAAIGYMNVEAARATDILAQEGISVEHIDLVSLRPLDRATLLRSVAKTRRLVVVDGGWPTAGASAEIAATVAECPLVHRLRAPVVRIGLPEAPAPMSRALEEAYYPRMARIVEAVRSVLMSDSKELHP